MSEKKMIPKAECKDRQLYRIFSRNLSFGVYHAETGGFFGLRTKFNDVYVFEEYHRENAAFGTVSPKEELPERLPDEIPNKEYLGSACSRCRKSVEYVKWPEGGQREISVGGKPMMVEGEWQHLEATDCNKVIPMAIGNEKLEKWLHEMIAKYSKGQE